MCLELVIGKNTCLFEAIHTFSNFKIDVAFGVKVFFSELVGVNNLLRKVAAMDAHVLENFHVRGKKEIL